MKRKIISMFLLVVCLLFSVTLNISMATSETQADLSSDSTVSLVQRVEKFAGLSGVIWK